MIGIAAIGVALALAATAGCNRNVEPFVPGEQPGVPDLAHIFPPEPSQQKDLARVKTSSGTDAASRASGPPLGGVVRLADGAQAPAGAVLFVIARKDGVPGPPLAVVRAQDPTFPYAFTLSQSDVMMPNTVFAGPMRLTARLDGDGNAMTRDAGDLEAALTGAAQPGTGGIELVLGAATLAN